MGYHVTPATFAVFLLLVFITCCSAHGGMQEPPMRSLAWRYGFDVPINYDWNSLYCGGFSKFQQSGGKCGLCGDPYDGPFENDRGGPYDTGIIVRHYPAGMRQIDVKFELTAYHKGNSLGRHENGTSCIGCGLQETFINCADISIGGTVDNIFVRNDTNSPETDIVIPQTANVTQITDDAPSDSFEAVIRALRGFHQFVDRRFNAPGANVATQDSGMVGTRRGAGDHPGINPDQMNVPRNNLQGAGVNSRRVLPGLQPNRNRVPDLHGFPADQTQNTRNRFRTKSQQVQAGRMPVFSHRNSGFPPRTSHGSALGATSGLARNTQLHNRQRIPNGYTNAVVPPNEFGSQMNRMAWHRGDGRTSPRELVRHNSHLDTRDFSTTDIRQHVPQLSRNVELRQDGFPLLQRRQQQYMVPERENWFPNTPAFVQSRRLRAHSDRLRMRNGQSTPFSLPRRIEVDTINVAQHLLRKYPQLRGRVFLSRRGC
ncbi:hypothetical protein MAR_034144 [Mya arenaria]|uniref:Chitin-binding type-4 domain-containing protein n=1 Tax=Mya arenaria TaxID=6604 RepID=A0ABY7GE36_MYAAR|nr:hypothetical protein MAR_034144 [Mya arenaria]